MEESKNLNKKSPLPNDKNFSPKYSSDGDGNPININEGLHTNVEAIHEQLDEDLNEPGSVAVTDAIPHREVGAQKTPQPAQKKGEVPPEINRASTNTNQGDEEEPERCPNSHEMEGNHKVRLI